MQKHIDWNKNSWIVFLLVFAALCFFPFLGGVHLFDWDEINFAEISREMLITGDWSQVQVGFQPFYEKPPLFFWLQAISMRLWGVGEYAARFPNAVCGILTLSVLIYFGKYLRNLRFGLFWAAFFLGSFLPHMYFRSGIIDPWFNFFMLMCLVFAFRADREQEKAIRFLILSGIAAGLAILTKGPVGLLIPGLVILVVGIRKRISFPIMVSRLLIVGLLSLLTASTWFAYEWISNGPEFIRAFILYQWDLLIKPGAGHSGFPGYHVVVLLVGCFPASVLSLPVLFRKAGIEGTQRAFTLWMKVLLLVVLVLFTIVESKIVHYSSMAYFPVCYLASITAEEVSDRKIILPKWIKGLFVFITFLFFSVFTAIWVALNSNILRAWLPTTPEIEGILSLNVHTTGLEWIPAALVLLWLGLIVVYYIRRQSMRSLLVTTIGMAIIIEIAIYSFVPRVEKYAQRSLVEFYQEHAGKDAYLHSYRFKTYIPVFYGLCIPGTCGWGRSSEWLVNGTLDKPAYFAARMHRADELKEREDIQELYRKGGFVFFVRQIPESTE